MNAQYFIMCIDATTAGISGHAVKAICIIATFDNGDWIPNKIGGPFDTRRKARIAAKREAIERNMTAYDTTASDAAILY